MTLGAVPFCPLRLTVAAACWYKESGGSVKKGAGVGSRALDYYMKGLSIEVRQALHNHMSREISETMVKWFLEKQDGYPSFRSCGYSDGDIELIGEAYAQKFEHANKIMADNGRPPLFGDPHDSYRSAQEHAEMMKERSGEELAGMFGCSFGIVFFQEDCKIPGSYAYVSCSHCSFEKCNRLFWIVVFDQKRKVVGCPVFIASVDR